MSTINSLILQVTEVIYGSPDFTFIDAFAPGSAVG